MCWFLLDLLSYYCGYTYICCGICTYEHIYILYISFIYVFPFIKVLWSYFIIGR